MCLMIELGGQDIRQFVLCYRCKVVIFEISQFADWQRFELFIFFSVWVGLWEVRVVSIKVGEGFYVLVLYKVCFVIFQFVLRICWYVCFFVVTFSLERFVFVYCFCLAWIWSQGRIFIQFDFTGMLRRSFFTLSGREIRRDGVNQEGASFYRLDDVRFEIDLDRW